MTQTTSTPASTPASTPTTVSTPGVDGYFGEAPTVLRKHRLTGPAGDLDVAEPWTEFMHYLDLPVRLPAHDGGKAEQDDITLPARLEFLRAAAYEALDDARRTTPHLLDPYVYVTARRGFASPGSPLNRPGWHADDWGGTDLNYIWSDRFPTRLLLSDVPLDIPDDDAESMRAMQWLAEAVESTPDPALRIVDSPLNTLVRLTPFVVHDTPLIPAPGGMRSFFKITVATRRYDLVGNSRNYDLDYDWPMVERGATRNQASRQAAQKTQTLQEA